MMDTIHAIIKGQKFCVLATYSDKTPYCSLMSYGTNYNCSEIYMATMKDSKKYRNIRLNPSVSLLIDTRENSSAYNVSSIKSLTVMGEFREIDDTHEDSKIRSVLIRRHPDLSIILDNRDSVILTIRIKSLLLLDGIDKPYFIQVEDDRAAEE